MFNAVRFQTLGLRDKDKKDAEQLITSNGGMVHRMNVSYEGKQIIVCSPSQNNTGLTLKRAYEKNIPVVGIKYLQLCITNNQFSYEDAIMYVI